MNISRRKSAAVVAVVGILCLATRAQAQSKVDTSKVYKLDEVIISASRFEESPTSVGRNVTVISKDDIAGSIHNSVAGILAEQQSLHIVGDRQTPGSLQQGFLRNANNNHFVVMLDGTRISDPSSNNNGVDLSELSVAGVERIEIVRGSHSTLYGSSAIGGVINIITQKAGVEGINASLSTQHGIMNAGSYATSNNININATSGNGFYANLSAFQQYSRGLDATVDTVSNPGVFNPQDQDPFNKLDLMGKIGFQNKVADIHLSYRKVDQTSDLDAGSYSDDNNTRIDFRRDLFNYGASYNVSNRLTFKFDGAYSDLTRDFVNDSSMVDTQGNYDGTYTETNGEGMLWKNELTAAFDDGQVRLMIGAGSSVQTMSSRAYTYISSFDYESTTDLDSLNLKETLKSLFVHADLSGSLLSTNLEPFSLVLGSRMVNHNRFGTHFTYEINPQVQITPTSLVYGAITTGFNTPSLYQLYAPEQGFGAYTSRGNETLDPETSVSYELGWKHSFDDMVQVKLSLFKTQVRDVIEYVYLWNRAAAIDELGFADYRGDTYINVARQDVNGIELGLNIRAIPRVNIGGNLAYTRSTLSFSPGDINVEYTGGHHVQIFESGVFVNEETDVEGLTRRPNVSARISADYKPLDRWTIHLSTRFVGERDDVFYSAGLGPYGALDRSRVSGYNLTDIGIRNRINKNLTVGVQVENVFDTDYIEINGYQTRGRSVFLKASFNL